MSNDIAVKPLHGPPQSQPLSINVMSDAQTSRPSASVAMPHTSSDAFTPDVRKLQHPPPISIAVNPVALITTECIAVTSAMRKHSRWSQSSVSAILGGGGATRVYEQETAIPPSPRMGPAAGKKSARNDSLQPDTGAGEDEQSLASRWGLRSRKGRSIQENPLMSAFARLRADLVGCRNIRTFDTPSLLHPFLQVIRSSSTSAPITSLALVAITKFFAYNLIGADSPNLSLAIQLLSAAITHCRFEASESAADEIVLLRILRLMEGMFSGPGGEVLGDESVCGMMTTGLSMCCQARLSELMRRSAEMTMMNICQLIFERLKQVDVEVPSNVKSPNQARQQDSATLIMDPSVDGDTVVSHQHSSHTVDANDTDTPRPSDDGMTETATLDGAALESTLVESPSTEVTPYSLPSIRELFRVLIDLLDPHNREHTDTMRVMALRIIDVALEVAGPSIAKHPSLAQLAKDDLCRHLFQLVRSENVALLNGSLRVAGTLLTTCRAVLKLQQELYLSYLVACLHPRVEIPREPGIDPSLYEGVPQAPKLVRPPPSQSSSGRSTPVPVKDRQKLGMEGGSRKPDAREAMVENIGALARIPTFMVELFVNYDCEVDRADLCEDMIGLLSRNAFPDSATWSTTNVPPLCLDALLGYVNFIAERLHQTSEVDHHLSLTKLKEQRSRKKIVMRGASKFNEDPKGGIAYLAAQGIIENPNDPHSVTKFLKSTTRISKKVLGDYICKKSNLRILESFINLFDFTDKRVDEAVRELLGSFRLPGESPLIERIVTVFSERYCATAAPEEIADKDAVFVLTYAIIMLNTDQHNPNVIKAGTRMSYTDFTRNLRGVNGGKDFPSEYLQAIYDNIKNNEIILPDEHDNKHAFEYAWKELLLKTEGAGDLFICDTNAFDADMFDATWKPIVATLSYVFLSASDDAVYSRVVMGFHQCAQVAATYGLSEAFDRIVYSLISISTLASEPLPSTALNTEVQVGQKRVMVSELAVKFGRNFRAQLATAVLFRVLTGNEAVVQKHWSLITGVLLNLFVNSLISPFPSQPGAELDIPPIPLQTPSQIIDRDQRANESGIFQAFTSYLSSYAADDPPEPSDEELNNTLSTVDCIDACSVDNVLTNILTMPAFSVSLLVSSLLSELPEESSPVVIVVKPERPNSTVTKANGHRSTRSGPFYNPNILWTLELATLLTMRDHETLEASGESLTAALQNVVRDAPNLHPLIVSRVVYYLLTLLRGSYEFPFMRAPVVLHAISSFDQERLDNAALPILKGLSSCVSSSGPLRNEVTSSPDFWSILQRLHKHKEGAEMVYGLLQSVVNSAPSAVTADNYESAVSLANDFATAGSVGALVEQRRDMAARRPKGGKQPPKPKDNEVVIRGAKAIGIVYQMTSRIANLIQQSHLERHEAWAAYWSPIFGALSTQCVNPCREIRHQAISALNRSLLSPDLASPDHTEWIAIFAEVLFPLIVRLLKPEVYQSDPIGMSETRVQAATLVCRIFLYYLVLLSEWEGMLDLWLKILDMLDRMMNSGQGDSLEEAVPESLKNILLVMANGKYLVPPSEDPSKEKLWVETRKRLERFLPNLFEEIFPPAKGTEAVKTATADSGVKGDKNKGTRQVDDAVE